MVLLDYLSLLLSSYVYFLAEALKARYLQVHFTFQTEVVFPNYFRCRGKLSLPIPRQPWAQLVEYIY